MLTGWTTMPRRCCWSRTNPTPSGQRGASRQQPSRRPSVRGVSSWSSSRPMWVHAVGPGECFIVGVMNTYAMWKPRQGYGITQANAPEPCIGNPSVLLCCCQPARVLPACCHPCLLQAPKTAENFRCLCTGEKGLGKASKKPLHYRGNKMHRIVKGFVCQVCAAGTEGCDVMPSRATWGPGCMSAGLSVMPLIYCCWGLLCCNLAAARAVRRAVGAAGCYLQSRTQNLAALCCQ